VQLSEASVRCTNGKAARATVVNLILALRVSRIQPVSTSFRLAPISVSYLT